MAGQMAKDDVIKACLQGVKNAQVQYVDMAGEWISWGPEYFITTHIAQALHKATGSKFVTVENGARNALEAANATGRGRLHRDIRSEGRFDLLLWRANESPRAVIEVKNWVVSKSQYEPDLKRILEVLGRKSAANSISFGLFAFYTDADSSSKNAAVDIIDSRMELILKNAREIVGSKFKVSLSSRGIRSNSRMERDGDSAWAACCLLIEPK